MNRNPKRTFDRTDELPTAADYIAVGAAPLLIMVMVGALVWFAQDLVYQGEHALRLRWTLFWFVIGMVGISRIAIERTPAYAGLFALGLGGAVAILINQFFVMPVTGWLLLALIWWCTNQLVWDCTLLDEKEDASGEGLLEIAGMDETAGNEPRADVAVKHIAAGQRRPAASTWWRWLFLNRASRAGRPHAHGLWIIYFSLAALPLFGLGQAVLARTQTGSPGLFLLAVYLAAATGLLLLTSFLGLRRYLRQRRLKMPAAIAGTWMGVGAFIALAVLLFSLVLPRPITITSPRTGGAALTGRQLDERSSLEDADAEQGDAQSPSGNETQDNAGDPGRSAGTDSATADSAAGKQSGGRPDGKTTSDRGKEGPTAQLPRMPDWLRALGWVLVAGVILYLLVRYWREILAAIRELIASLRGLLQASAKTRGRVRNAKAVAENSARPTRRFADVKNPFGSGQAVDPALAVQQTYEALELWAAERGHARAPEMTATEFAHRLMGRHPELSDGIRFLVRVYGGWIYGDRRPLVAELSPLAALWTALEARQ